MRSFRAWYEIGAAKGYANCLLVTFAIVALCTARADAQNTTSMAGTLRVAEPTIHSIGFEWDLTGDENHNATSTVRYRAVGASTWRDALGLQRVDYQGWYVRCCDDRCCGASPDPRCSNGHADELNGIYNTCQVQGKPMICCADSFDIDQATYRAAQHFDMFAGSILFLDPNTPYEIELSVADPDNGGAVDSETLNITTRPVPRLAPPLRTFHVVPGSGGGDGSVGNPFQGVQEAEADAQPGDLYLFHAGAYQVPDLINDHDLTKSGAPGQYIAWKPAGDGTVLFRTGLWMVGTNHRWFEGFTFEPASVPATFPEGIGFYAFLQPAIGPIGIDDVVITRNTFRNCSNGIVSTYIEWLEDRPKDPSQMARHWYVADNVYEGRYTSYANQTAFFGDSDFAFNRISMSDGGQLSTRQGDGFACNHCRNVDFYGNDLRDIGDDAFEPDFAYANMRFWKNRVVNRTAQFLSFQPQFSAPWYVVRNEFIGNLYQPGVQGGAGFYKANVFDRWVQVNNTFLVGDNYLLYRADLFLRAYSRNNIFVHRFVDDNNPGGTMLFGTGNLDFGSFGVIHGQSHADWKTDIDYDAFHWDAALDAPGSCASPSGFSHAFWWGASDGGIRHYKDLSCFTSDIGIEPHGRRIFRSDEFLNDDDSYRALEFPAAHFELKAGAASIDAGVVVPNLSEDFVGLAPDLGAYEFGGAAPHYGPRNCGNGVIDAGEACDDAQPAADGDGCSATCQIEPCWDCSGVPAVCTTLPNGTTCDDGAFCTSNDSCSAGVCDGGARDCGDGDLCTTDACNEGSDSCTHGSNFVCGDGVLCGSEGCDDGNAVSGDGCDTNCTATGCGNGVVSAGEVCDDGNAVNADGCDANCTATACGNGITTGAETCDDGNGVNGDGCDSNCTVTACGNGIATGSEACDDGDAGNGDGCDTNCTVTACGNGIVTFGEFCDDGNLVSDDGCDSDCRPSGCGNGSVAGVEQCDDGNIVDGDGCDRNCTASACGNGVRTANEACDDGNLANGDGCQSDCTTTPVVATVAPGATVTTDPSGDGPNEANPATSEVVTPNGGTVSIAAVAPPADSPGLELVGVQFNITAPPATVANPLILSFTIDSSAIPIGLDPIMLAVLRNGVIVADCSGAPGHASPSPCVESRSVDAGGDVTIVVLTAAASAWTFAVEVHDSMVMPTKPLKVSIGAGKASVTKMLKATVRNVDLTGQTIALAAISDCPGMTVGVPDFDDGEDGPQTSVVVAGGKTANAAVPLTFDRTAYTSIHLKAPFRCRVVLGTQTLPQGGSLDPTASNNNLVVEVNVVDKNDADQAGAHESYIASVKPIALTIPKGSASAIKALKAVVGNADRDEDPGDPISVTVVGVDCPDAVTAELAGLIDFDNKTAGSQGTIVVKGGGKKSGKIPLTAARAAFETSNPKSPSRCTVSLQANGPGGTNESTNDTTIVTVDVVDNNDLP